MFMQGCMYSRLYCNTFMLLLKLDFHTQLLIVIVKYYAQIILQCYGDTTQKYYFIVI